MTDKEKPSKNPLAQKGAPKKSTNNPYKLTLLNEGATNLPSGFFEKEGGKEQSKDNGN